MKQIVSFDKLKLTNNLLDDNGHVGATFLLTTTTTIKKILLVIQTFSCTLGFVLIYIYLRTAQTSGRLRVNNAWGKSAHVKTIFYNTNHDQSI